MDKKLFYTVNELKDLLGVSRSLIYKLVEEKEIPCRRLGSRILIPSVFVEGILDGESA